MIFVTPIRFKRKFFSAPSSLGSYYFSLANEITGRLRSRREGVEKGWTCRMFWQTFQTCSGALDRITSVAVLNKAAEKRSRQSSPSRLTNKDRVLFVYRPDEWSMSHCLFTFVAAGSAQSHVTGHNIRTPPTFLPVFSTNPQMLTSKWIHLMYILDHLQNNCFVLYYILYSLDSFRALVIVK